MWVFLVCPYDSNLKQAMGASFPSSYVISDNQSFIAEVRDWLLLTSYKDVLIYIVVFWVIPPCSLIGFTTMKTSNVMIWLVNT
jgi:hypothetical protein